MKIAEALIKRSTITSELNSLKERMIKNAKIQEGDTPQENVSELMKLYKDLSDELCSLIIRINKSNQLVTNADGVSLADLLTERDTCKSLTRTCKAVYDEAILVGRYSRNEIRLVSAIDAAAIQNDISSYVSRYREIDIQIQSINWTADLAD